MLLENKNAVIYGGGGSIGGAVARAFAREGAKVHLAGRTLESLEEVAEEIRSTGGAAETAQVDALDETAVDEHADAMAARAGGIDISFNLISHGDVQGTPLAEMPLEDFERPVMTAVRTMFLTSRAAARHMIKQGSGVILAFGGYGDPLPGHYLGGLQVAFGAIESLRRNLACELGPHGIRVVTLQTGGVPESITESFDGREAIVKEIEERTMLKRAATLGDVGRVAAFAASDQARTITASAINITCGSMSTRSGLSLDCMLPLVRELLERGESSVSGVSPSGPKPYPGEVRRSRPQIHGWQSPHGVAIRLACRGSSGSCGRTGYPGFSRRRCLGVRRGVQPVRRDPGADLARDRRHGGA